MRLSTFLFRFRIGHSSVKLALVYLRLRLCMSYSVSTHSRFRVELVAASRFGAHMLACLGTFPTDFLSRRASSSAAITQASVSGSAFYSGEVPGMRSCSALYRFVSFTGGLLVWSCLCLLWCCFVSWRLICGRTYISEFPSCPSGFLGLQL